MTFFAPPGPLWAQFSPDHVQITQGKQHIELGVVLGQPLVARLLVIEDVLDYVKRVLHVGPDLGFEFLVGLRHALLPAVCQFGDGLASFGNMPLHGLLIGGQRLLHVFSLLRANVTGIGPDRAFLSV